MSYTSNDPLFRKSMAFCAWSGFAAIIFFIIGGVWLGGMLPPLLHADEPAAEFVRKVTEHLFEIRSVFCVPDDFLRAVWPLRCRHGRARLRAEQSPVFSYVQLIFTACGTMIALLVAFTLALTGPPG